MTSYRVTDLVTGLPATVPFVGPEAQERAQGRVFDARIGANENMFGPSPTVIDAIIEMAGESWMYGDPELHDLRHAIARHHEIPVGNVAIGEGIDGLLGYFSRMFIEPGYSVVTSAGAYPTFNYHVVGYGGQLETVPYCDDHEDIEGLLRRAADSKAKLLYFANPDNPMGTWWDAPAVSSMMSRIPDGTVLLLDEAYGEFAEAATLPGFDLSNEKVLRFRTFSKAYGMAGIRVGYVVGHCRLIAELDKVRNHFGVGRVAQAAALAAPSAAPPSSPKPQWPCSAWPTSPFRYAPSSPPGKRGPPAPCERPAFPLALTADSGRLLVNPDEILGQHRGRIGVAHQQFYLFAERGAISARDDIEYAVFGRKVTQCQIVPV